MTTSSTSAHPIEATGRHEEMLPHQAMAIRPKSDKHLRTIYVSALLLLLSIGGITFAFGTFHKVYYPFGWDDDEGDVWWVAAHVRATVLRSTP